MKKCTVHLYWFSNKAGNMHTVYKHCTCPAFDEGHLEKGSVCFVDEYNRKHVAYVDTYEVVSEE